MDRRINKGAVTRFGALLLAGAFLAAVPAVAADPAKSDKKLFESKCSICHSLDRPLGERMDRAGWTATVTKMQKVNRCPITDEEAKRIVDYLVSVRGKGGK